MATAADAGERGVSVGRVFARTFGVVRHHPGAVLGTALLLGALPRLGLGYVQAHLLEGFSSDTFLAEVGFFAASTIIGLILTALVQGAIVRVTVAQAAGERVGWAESLAAGLRAALPLVALAVVTTIAIAIATMLAIIPGAILFVIWAVAAPALVAERLGVIAALGRSTRLTKGARWLVLGIELLALVCYYLASGVLLWAGIALGAGHDWIVLGSTGGWAATILGLAVSTLRSALWAALQTALYVELRDWKDGPAAGQLAAIFS